MPQRGDNTTPPTIEELMRRMTGDTSSTYRSSYNQSDAVFSRPSTRHSSITGTDVDSLRRTDTNILIRGLARSMTKKMPAIRSNRSLTEKESQGVSMQDTDGPEGLSSARINKKSHKLSVQLPLSLKKKARPEILSSSNPFVAEPSTCPMPNKLLPGPSPRLSGLAARRRVRLDLKLPVGLPDLSKANAHHGTHTGILSSITPSRPRSPKTPWIREKGVTWSPDAESTPSETVSSVEDVSIPIDTVDTTTRENEDIGFRIELAPSPTASEVAGIDITAHQVLFRELSPLSTPAFERPSHRIRDRGYVSHPSGESNANRWLTNDSDLGSTPDSRWMPKAEKGLTEQDAHLQEELFQLAKTSKAARARRWPWRRSKASGSEEQSRTEDERNEESKGISVNIFKRSHRFPESQDKEKKEKKSNHMSPLWRRPDKPPLASASLANMLVPPTFVPPGSEKVLTPPALDSAREVRGKLADFFFDKNGLSSSRRKSNAGLGGHWDSNAVLMSMHTDLDLTHDKDEEGPEGRPPPIAFHFGPVNDTPGPEAAPGLYTAPDGYLRVKGVGISPSQRSLVTPVQGAQDSWFRMHYSDYAADEEVLTAAALKEADERRKFEWLVPEHLPNSPLCPLHPRYVGPSKGLCYWHGRKANGWGVEPRRDYIAHPMKIGHRNSRGWEVGKVEATKTQKRKTRLQDLVDPI